MEKNPLINELARLNARRDEILAPKYSGHVDAPLVYSTLEDGLVPTGRDLNQCPHCGFWMSDKPSPSEEREHNRQCDW